jgi:SNF2 family DNA or RNA helicase
MPENLFDYQKIGVKFLVDSTGGFLWDEPGLGKTRQAIVAAKQIVPITHGSILVVCPSTLRGQWRDEIAKVYPDDTVMIADVGGRFYNDTGKQVFLHDIAQSGSFPVWTIVHYDGLRIAKEEFKQIFWGVVVADEAHFVKNRKALRTKALWEVTPKLAGRIGLTATPWGKDVSELWSQLRWMCPDCPEYRSYWKFFNQFVDYRDTWAGYREIKGIKNADILATLMSGFGLRRTKNEVRADMPQLIYTTVPLFLESGQKALYQKAKKEVKTWLGDNLVTIKNALTRMNYLWKIISCPWIFSPMEGVKMEWLREWAEGFNKPAVILTHYKESAHAVARVFDTVAITGDMPQEARDEVVKDWKAGNQQFLVGTVHTMGTGLNLQEAYALVFYDMIADVTLTEQAMHRVNRIDSDHGAQIITLKVEGSVDELAEKSLKNRWSAVSMVRAFLEDLQVHKEVVESNED